MKNNQQSTSNNLLLCEEVKTTVHRLKTWSEFFVPLSSGKKTFEVRKNDREFKVGDVLILEEFDPEKNCHTGQNESFRVTYILPGGQFGIDPDFVVLAIKPSSHLNKLT